MDVVKIDTGHIAGTILGYPGRNTPLYRDIPYAAGHPVPSPELYKLISAPGFFAESTAASAW